MSEGILGGPNLRLAQAYLDALEQAATGDELARFFTDDVVQEESPNRLVPNDARRDLAGLLEGAARGGSIMRSQWYELLNGVESGDTVVYCD